MTFSKLIKSNKGNILPNKELNSLYKPILNKLDNQFIYDFTFKGPEFNQQLSLNIYKHIDPNISSGVAGGLQRYGLKQGSWGRKSV